MAGPVACSSVTRRTSPAPHRPVVILFKLSKLLNQEDALSVPWFRGGFVTSADTLAGRRNSADPVIRLFRRHMIVSGTQVIAAAGADTSPGCLAADARAVWADAKPSRTVMQDGADGGGYFHSSTGFEVRREG